jgi:Ca2+-binding EF-hand superfamily protein
MNVAVARCAFLLLAAGPVLPAAAAEEVTAAAGFNALDVDRDGVVSRYEYDGDFAFAAMDADGDRRLSPAQIDSLLGRVAKDGPSAAERIVVADLDHDGQLDENELRRATEMRFTSMDRNGDGNLDEAEFATGFGARAR